MTTAPTVEAKPTRPASRKGAIATTTTVLSPKSHNPRVPPRSPLKSSFAEKTSSIAAKSSSPVKSTAPTSSNPSSRAPSRQTKRPGTALSTVTTGKGRESEGSATSAGTTIVSKPGAKKSAPTRKPPTAKLPAATTKRAAAVKKEPVVPAPAAAGRTLRKRA
jgi:hypothetical protein